MDKGAWWATVHRVAQSQTQLERLSTHAEQLYPRDHGKSEALCKLWTTRVLTLYSRLKPWVLAIWEAFLFQGLLTVLYILFLFYTTLTQTQNTTLVLRFPTPHWHKESVADVTEAGGGVWRDATTVANNLRWSSGHPCPFKSLSHFCNLSSSLSPCGLASFLSLHGLIPFLLLFALALSGEI